MNHQRAFILGSGSFGSRAFFFLQPRFHLANLTVVDLEYHKLEKIIAEGGHAIVMDVISFLRSSKGKIGLDDWIIPAIPIHVAYEWLRQELKSIKGFTAMPVPEKLETILPNPIRGVDGQLYASNANFKCPDNCPEPDGYCTITGEPRPQILYDTLSSLSLSGFVSICIVSHQLAPGVGGFQLRALHQALEEIQSNPGKILVSTSCKCHCVMHAFSLQY